MRLKTEKETALEEKEIDIDLKSVPVIILLCFSSCFVGGFWVNQYHKGRIIELQSAVIDLQMKNRVLQDEQNNWPAKLNKEMAEMHAGVSYLKAQNDRYEKLLDLDGRLTDEARLTEEEYLIYLKALQLFGDLPDMVLTD